MKTATLPGAGETFKNATYHALNSKAGPGIGSQLLWDQALTGSTNYVGLGRYLHYLQDTFSHATFSNSYIGHLFGTHGVDKTSSDVAKTVAMAKTTFDALNEYAREKKNCNCQTDWDISMSDMVREFARIETNHKYLSTIDAQRFNPDTFGWDFLPFFLGGDRSAFAAKAGALGFRCDS